MIKINESLMLIGTYIIYQSTFYYYFAMFRIAPHLKRNLNYFWTTICIEFPYSDYSSIWSKLCNRLVVYELTYIYFMIYKVYELPLLTKKGGAMRGLVQKLPHFVGQLWTPKQVILLHIFVFYSWLNRIYL